jgi:hypothetical protein
MIRTNDDERVASNVSLFKTRVEQTTSVGSMAEYVHLAKSLVELRRAKDYVKARKEQITAPAKALTDTAKEWFGATEKAIDSTEKRLKDLLEVFIETRADTAQGESKAALDAGDVQKSIALMTIVPDVEGLSIRNEVAFEVIDYNAVPDEFFERTIRTSAIKTALKAGEQIPGIVRKDRVQIAISTKD